jgi:hypothetical protein
MNHDRVARAEEFNQGGQVLKEERCRVPFSAIEMDVTSERVSATSGD